MTAVDWFTISISEDEHLAVGKGRRPIHTLYRKARDSAYSVKVTYVAQCQLVAGNAGGVKVARKNQRSSLYRFPAAFLNVSKTMHNFLTKIKKIISIKK